MSGWLRYFTLKAQVSTGLSPQIAIWAVVALAGALLALAFLLAALFIWLAHQYDGVTAGLILGGALAAPLAAYAAYKIPDQPLMILVGSVIVLLSIRGLLRVFG